MRTAIAVLSVIALAGCSKAPSEFPAFTQEFVERTLALSPTGATAAGLHSYNGVRLDEHLDDYSVEGLERARATWKELASKLARFDRAKLDAESRADAELMDAQIRLAELDANEIQSKRHNPTVYVEAIGNGLFVPYSVEYASADARWHHIVARLNEVPRVLDEARAQLIDTPPIWKQVAIEENEGTIGLIEQEFATQVPAAQKADYGKAAQRASAAMRSFNDWLRTSLKESGAESWRLGKDKYAKLFAASMGSTMSPDELLQHAEESLTETRRAMFRLALPLHHKLYPKHVDPVDVNLIVGETLKKIAERHPTREGYMDAARATLDESRAFLKAHPDKIIADPPRDNLRVIETPAFMRGVYGVGGFNPAPPLEPQLGAFYWVTPIPQAWSQERVDSKLREYNDYGLRILTIHEAIPGHYVQAEYASRVEPSARRALRAVYGSGVYVEGWAVYATAEMIKAGYYNDAPELALQNLKWELRAIANTILDIRYHTQALTDEQALALMMDKTFQEREEAVAKVQRAKLGACQLPTYFAGYTEWKRLRAAMEQKAGANFKPAEFHQRALLEGALPMGTLGRVLGAY